MRPHALTPLIRTHRPTATLLGLLVACAAVLIGPESPAEAVGRVSVANPDGAAVIDTTYATDLTVSGSGFQSIQGGHGGIYVFFGTVSNGWQPSAGGQTGRDYFYVPDSESADNQGFQKYVAFPGSDTGASANGGQIDADGTWSTSLTVPGATFQAADRDGNVKQIDCTQVQCGIITIGAHGVVNGTNESFTPVEVGDLYGGQAPADAAPAVAPEVVPAQPGAVTAVAELKVDRTAALPGRIMTFTAVGLVPGELVVATLDDGLAAAGPIAVGTNGQVAGALQLPLDLEPGTHTLRLSGEQGLTVSFAVRALDDQGKPPWLAIGIAIAAGVLLLLALAGSALWIRSARRKAAA
ncbi:hypothetical protein [Aeromicrobium sp.]|uniref:hypothetical protein n=1 Tax=Aeromicrobium sp. TaxID=1871063 RepID=UPI0025C5414D|nr:hypothetical protein [Aeromicrobium sp.]MCK5891914.1 hypothetical protein [Aeromicrobium sp.]